jgi:uncharacterized protein YbbC (DUF1343 family)
MKNFLLFCFCLIAPLDLYGEGAVSLGIDQLQLPRYSPLLRNKKIGVLTNQTGKDSSLQPSYKIIAKLAEASGGKLSALFAPEHGLHGDEYAERALFDGMTDEKIPIHSLYGKTTKPTADMLKGITLLIYDIQDIGTRSYTYATTLFYLMEASALHNIPLLVLDRPNPINGVTVDGPLLDKDQRSFVGYIDVPYCHGMTIGELALFFNAEYQIGCKLQVIPMAGWKREMSYSDTGCHWVPTSPQIPESTTALYYPMTGLIGQLSLASIGIGYTLPFKVVGAPWILADPFCEQLNKQNFAGVHFVPFHFIPFHGKYAKEKCHGALIVITDPLQYKPVAIQFLLIGMIKTLYPSDFQQLLPKENSKIEAFQHACGTAKVYDILREKKSVVWPLMELYQKRLNNFLQKRKKYLLPDYS